MEHAKQKTFIKPFYHVAACSFFRLACMVEFEDENKLADVSQKSLAALASFQKYASSIKSKIRKRTHQVRGRRKSINRIKKSPFTKGTSSIFYGMAIEVENTLERHYQLRSGETYLLLTKASLQMYEAVSGKVLSVIHQIKEVSSE